MSHESHFPPCLSAHELSVAHPFLAAQGAQRRHLVVALSGAHAYGFPSPDSDLDLKAVHMAPTRAWLGMSPPSETAEITEIVEGVELDYSSNEIHAVLAGLLAGNGNYLERILAAIPLVSGPELASLKPLAEEAISRRMHRHYRGFALNQAKEMEKVRTAKRILYVLRTTLTGTHLLRTGELVTDVTALLDDYGFGDARELLALKRAGEGAALPDDVLERFRAPLANAFAGLDAARDASSLPEEPSPAVIGALDAWLVGARLALLK